MNGDGRGRAQDPAERLLRSTRLRLGVLTLGLVAALLVAMGLMTAALAITALDAEVDRSMRASAGALRETLEAPLAEDASSWLDPIDDWPPAAPDSFTLVVRSDGSVIARRGSLAPDGPDRAALAAAIAGGQDVRGEQLAGLHVRVLTQPVTPAGWMAPAAYLQTAVPLAEDDREVQLLLGAIVVAVVAGLAGAALVTVVVTRRALVPIRTAFQAERRFVASASHELRTPVAVIRASAEILQREGLVRPEGERLTADIVGESDRLGRLVDDLLALASAEAGAMSFDHRPVDLAALVVEVAGRAGSVAAAREVTVLVDADGDARRLTVDADPDRLRQLLHILLANAVEHSPQGGVVSVSVDPAPDGRSARVTVADQGPGIPSADRQRVFEPFERLEGRPRAVGGSGLGLAIARLLAAGHEATLELDDAPGGGARFSLRLPIVSGSPRTAPEPAAGSLPG